MEEITLATPAGDIPAVVEGEGETGILLAPGAGTSHTHSQVAGLRTRLADLGHQVMSFDYPYRVAGRAFPDRVPTLLATHRAAADALRHRVGRRLVLAGRSMGGRMATMLAADGEPCLAVVVYGYPLHPAGKPERLRIEHLGAVEVPLLLIGGTEDALARPDLVTEHLAPLPTATLVRVEGADHSFRLRGTTPGQMLDRLAAITRRWLEGVTGVGGTGGDER